METLHILFTWWPNLMLLPHISLHETPMACFLLHRPSQLLHNFPPLTSMASGYRLPFSPHVITWLWRPKSSFWDVHYASQTSLLGLSLMLLHKLGIFGMLSLNTYCLWFECLPFWTPYSCWLSTLSTNASFVSKRLIPIKLLMVFLLLQIPINDDAFLLGLHRFCYF